jgi:GAF domain-containing protein
MRPISSVYFASKVRRLQESVRPVDDAHQHVLGNSSSGSSSSGHSTSGSSSSGGANPRSDSDWVLVVGGGVARGWGVSSHQQALPGQIARALHERTFRGAEVELAEAWDTGGVTTALAEAAVAQYDSIVVTWGMAHAVSLGSERSWRKTIERVIASLLAESAVKSSIVVVAIPPVRALIGFNNHLGAIVEEHSRALNAITEQACAVSPRIRFIHLPIGINGITGLTGNGRGAATSYWHWGDSIANAISPCLEVPVPRGESRPNEEARQRAVDELKSRPIPQEEIDQIVIAARSAYGMTAAAFTLVDNDEHSTVSVTGFPVTTMPRIEAACDVAMHYSGAIVVADTKEDARFRHVPVVRAYAGHPIVSPDGLPVGMLCVMNTEPLTADAAEAIDTTLLRELALMVQKRLWGGGSGSLAA